VAIGDIDVDVTAASAKGLRVDAKGLTPYLPVYDLREVCIDPTTTAEGVSILYLK
jgi:nitrogen fixation protein